MALKYYMDDSGAVLPGINRDRVMVVIEAVSKVE